MTDPFRNEESAALARMEALEAENAELTRELEMLRAKAEAREAHVKTLEDRNAELERSAAPKATTQPQEVDSVASGTVALIGLIVAVLAGIGGILVAILR